MITTGGLSNVGVGAFMLILGVAFAVQGAACLFILGRVRMVFIASFPSPVAGSSHFMVKLKSKSSGQPFYGHASLCCRPKVWSTT